MLSEKEEHLMREIYYQPSRALWTGWNSISKLKRKSKLSRRKVVEFLAKQVIIQVHIPPPKEVHHPHYEVTEPNHTHQFDLLYMPEDVVYKTKYLYGLMGEDIASRYKVIRFLRTKEAKEVAFALRDIYKAGPLKPPDVVMVDGGKEFQGSVTKLFEKHRTKIDREVTKYHHGHTGLAERFNKSFAERAFKLQDAQELNDKEYVSKIWVKYAYGIVEDLNNTMTRGIKMKPVDAIKLDYVKQYFVYKPDKFVLPEDGLYRYLYQPGEQHNDQKRRATDMIWSKSAYRLDRIIEEPKNRTLYYLQEGPKRAFVSEELMLIPEDSEAPPDWVKQW